MPWQYQSPQELVTPATRIEHYRTASAMRKQTLSNCGWLSLTDAEEIALEAQLRDRFPIRPESQPPEPYVVWDLSAVYLSSQTFDSLETDLNLNALCALRECTAPGESILAVDWQHPCFSFEPHAFPSTGDPYKWAVPFLPDGLISFFLPRDFRFGIICIPHSTICIYGKRLLDAFETNHPALLSKRMEWPLEPWPKGES